MADYKGYEYLKRRLSMKRIRVKKRYAYYEMKNRIKDLKISTPPNLRGMQSVLGWCGKAVDNLADRIVFREFSEDNFDIGEIFEVSDETTMINGRESYQVIQHNEPSALCIECCDCERVD